MRFGDKKVDLTQEEPSWSVLIDAASLDEYFDFD